MRVLLVDDTPDNLIIVSKLLEADGHSVHTARGGLAALDIVNAAERTFDIVFLDLMMPDLDGFQTLELLRRKHGPKATARVGRVVALTARTFPEDLARCKAAGFDATVEKPVTRQSLRLALQPDGDRSGPVKGEATSSLSALDAVEATIAALRPTWLRRRHLDADRLRAMIDARDLKGLAELGHRLAGSSETYGFGEVSHLSKSLEEAVRAEQELDAMEHAAALLGCLTALIEGAGSA